jgi:hypothetical protein
MAGKGAAGGLAIRQALTLFVQQAEQAQAPDHAPLPYDH